MSTATEIRSAVYDALPGMDTPVAEVRRALAAVWDGEPTRGKPAPSEFRASQMNLVVHFGLDSKPDEARAAFDSALAFSRRYPCRILALCPREPGAGGDVTAKIFCECYIGKSRKDMTCSEAIVLTYPLEQRAYLENQASIMLESDLPLYYWPQRISSARRLSDYKFFLGEAQRVLIDTALERDEVATFAWPRPEIVRDLVYARMLPVRQSVGHFLSYIPPARILHRLTGVRVRRAPGYTAEARVLTKWIRAGMLECARVVGDELPDLPIEAVDEPADTGASLVLEWTYANCRPMRFTFDFERGSAHAASCFTAGSTTLASSVRPLRPDSALAEAIFF
jgi:hypothetical protein